MAILTWKIPSTPFRTIAWTKSEARSQFARALGYHPHGGLPPHVRVQALPTQCRPTDNLHMLPPVDNPRANPDNEIVNPSVVGKGKGET